MEVKPGYKQTEAGVIPEDWDDPELGEIAKDDSPICYGIVQVGPHTANGIRVLAIKNLNSDYTTDIHRASVEIERAYARSRIRPDDVLISVKGTTGRVGIVPPGFNGNISRDLARIRVRELIVPKFCFQMLQSDLAQRRLAVAVVGTTRMELSIAVLKKVRIPIPPTKTEQKAIAEALNDADALIEFLEQLIAKKRALKQGAMLELLTGQIRLSDFRGEWEVKTLGKLGQISGAGVDKKIRPDEPPVRLVNYMDVYRRNFIYSKDLDHIVSARPEQAARCAVKRGDVFFTPSSEMPFDIAVSAVAMEDIPGAVYSYHVVRLRLDEDWDLLFRAYAFKSQEFLNQAARACEGSGVRYVITQAKFRQLSVRFPPTKEEQAAIGVVLSDMDAEIAALDAKLVKARQLKQGMMQELLTGRIRLV